MVNENFCDQGSGIGRGFELEMSRGYFDPGILFHIFIDEGVYDKYFHFKHISHSCVIIRLNSIQGERNLI